MIKSMFFLLLAMLLLLVASPFVVIYNTVVILKNKENLANYFYMIAVDGLDQLGGTILYRVNDLTISSYTFVLCTKGDLCWFKKAINYFFGEYHCELSAANELKEMKKKIKILEKALNDR